MSDQCLEIVFGVCCRFFFDAILLSCLQNPAISGILCYISFFIIAITLTVYSTDNKGHITVNACVKTTQVQYNYINDCFNVIVNYKYQKNSNSTGTCIRQEIYCYNDVISAEIDASTYKIGSCKHMYLDSYNDKTCAYDHTESNLLGIAIMFWVFFGLSTFYIVYLCIKKSSVNNEHSSSTNYTFNSINNEYDFDFDGAAL